MIKFFQKIRQKFIEQGKTANYLKYAIGEIVLVVIGILIALQINNWNQNRKDTNLEAKYQIRLLEDLYEEKAILQATLNYSNEVQKHAKKAMIILENSTLIVENPSESLIHLYQASQIQDPTSARATYQELIASGQINLIKNNNLKTSLIRYYEYNWTESASVNFTNNFRDDLRSIMSNNVQEEVRKNCDDIYIKIRKTYEVTLPKECSITISDDIAKSELELLRHDEVLKKNLRKHLGNIEAKNNFIKSTKKQLDQLISQFENIIK